MGNFPSLGSERLWHLTCRDARCDLQFKQKEISRKHAEVYTSANGAVSTCHQSKMLQAIYTTPRRAAMHNHQCRSKRVPVKAC